ncbi:MAG: hypothetical protein FWE03_05120 [Firmicutes bacterium]|nr:hypothetical protein [Bacillota bacterium]
MTPNFVSEFQIALDIAKEAHEGQFDKQGVNYFLRPCCSYVRRREG